MENQSGKGQWKVLESKKITFLPCQQALNKPLGSAGCVTYRAVRDLPRANPLWRPTTAEIGKEPQELRRGPLLDAFLCQEVRLVSFVGQSFKNLWSELIFNPCWPPACHKGGERPAFFKATARGCWHTLVYSIQPCSKHTHSSQWESKYSRSNPIYFL